MEDNDFFEGTNDLYIAKSFPDILAFKTKKLKFMLRGARAIGPRQALNYYLFCKRARKRKATPSKRQKSLVALILLPKFGIEQPPLAIASLKSMLQNKGFSCSCFDFNLKLYQQLEKRNRQILHYHERSTFNDETAFEKAYAQTLRDHALQWASEIAMLSPKYVGVSVTYYSQLMIVKRFIPLLRKVLPDAKIIVGGPVCSDKREQMVTEIGADYAIIGIGEHTLLHLIEALEHGNDIRKVESLIYREDEKIVFTNPSTEVVELDDFPFPDFSDFDLSSYETNNFLSNVCSLPIIASRGCTRNCTFCTYRHYMGRYRYRPPEHVFQEMLHQKYKHGAASFVFYDAMLNAKKGFLEELCDLIIESKEVFFWGGHFGFYEGIDVGLFRKLARAGCTHLWIGLESGSEKVRKDMAKPCSKETASTLLKEAKKAGIAQIQLLLIVGYPTETPSDFEETKNYLKTHHNRIDSVYISRCIILPHTPLFTIAAKEGYIQGDGIDVNWTNKDNTRDERTRRYLELIQIALKYGLINKTPAGFS